MKYNLQFFADGDPEGVGEQVSESAEQTETVNDSTEQAENTQGSEEATSDASVDRNAIFAEARRTFERKQAAINSRYAEKFKGLVNPETQQSINSAEEYLEALEAQERMRAKAELQSKGVDLSTIENLINNSPRLRQADQLIREMQSEKVTRQIETDLAELNKLDPSITGLESVPQEVINYTVAHNVPLTDAYKIVNFENASAKQAAAIKQGVINQIAGKQHLSPVNGMVQNDNMVDIPKENLASWRRLYPNLSDAELKKKYNNGLH